MRVSGWTVLVWAVIITMIILTVMAQTDPNGLGQPEPGWWTV